MKRITNLAIGTIIAIPLLLILIFILIRESRQEDWKKSTTPLPQATIELLCDRFELPSADELCNNSRDVYALDFVSIMKDKFRPYETYQINSSEAATYDDVEQIIGSFKYECESEETTGDGTTFFSCSYDLRGDKKFVVTILYTYPEKAVMRIMSTSRFYDY